MTYEKPCPHCGINLDGGDIYDIFRSLLEYRDRSDEEIEEIANNFGWTKENRIRFVQKIGQYDLEEDRTMYCICPHCENRLPKDF